MSRRHRPLSAGRGPSPSHGTALSAWRRTEAGRTTAASVVVTNDTLKKGSNYTAKRTKGREWARLQLPSSRHGCSSGLPHRRSHHVRQVHHWCCRYAGKPSFPAARPWAAQQWDPSPVCSGAQRPARAGDRAHWWPPGGAGAVIVIICTIGACSGYDWGRGRVTQDALWRCHPSNELVELVTEEPALPLSVAFRCMSWAQSVSSGNTRQRQCLSREASGNTRQGQS